MRRGVSLTPLGSVLIGLTIVAGIAAVLGASTIALIAVVVVLIFLLGALAPTSAQNLQFRGRIRPPDIPIVPPRDRPVRARRGPRTGG